MAYILRWQINGQNLQKELGEQQAIYMGNVTSHPSAPNWIFLPGTSVNNTHAVVRYDAIIRRYTIEDLNAQGSSYRTFIIRSRSDGKFENEQELLHHAPTPIDRADEIRIGQTIIRFDVEKDQTAQATNPSNGFNKFIGWLIVIVLIGVGINAFQNQNNSTSTPVKTLTDFCSAVKSGDYQTAYNQFSTQFQSQETEEQFASALEQTVSKQGGLNNCTVNGVKSNQTTATGTLTYSFADGKTVSNLDSLVTENSVWKIDSSKP